MIAVIDASAAAEVILQRDLSASLISIIAEAEWVIAPTVYIAKMPHS